MAERADPFGAKWVCKKCLQDNPRQKALLDVHCMNESAHEHFPEIRVWWRAEKNHLEIYDESAPGKVPKIRPAPVSSHGNMRFILCDRSRCWGDRCRYAHSIEEREVWNSRRFHSKHVPSEKQYNCSSLIIIFDFA